MQTLYKERYTAIPTKHSWRITTESKQVDYYWKIKNNWNHIKASATIEKEAMQPGGIEEFIFEHYYGYTKVSESHTEEYKVEHPRWNTNKINSVDINCDFEAMYGKRFSHLLGKAPSSVMMAEGSAIAVKWKREKLSFL